VQAPDRSSRSTGTANARTRSSKKN
jgi:hypothetical protein